MPQAPPRTPMYDAPNAWALSSITSRLWALATSITRSMRTIRPFRSTGMIALVRDVTAASSLSVSMLWSSPTSTRTGVAPTWWMTAIVAMNVCDTVMTSSPAPIPTASSSSLSPSVKLLTPTASVVPTNDARLCSKSIICCRMIRSPATSTLRIVLITSSSMRKNSLPGSQNLTDKSIAPSDDRLDRLHHSLLVKTVQRFQVFLIADHRVELRPQPDALQQRAGSVELGHHLGDGAAEPAFDAVLLEREHETGFGGCAHDSFAVERLDGMHAQQPDAQAFLSQLGGDAIGRREHAAAGDEREVRTLPHRNRAPQDKGRLVRMHNRLAGPAQPQIGRSVERDHGPGPQPRLDGIAGRDHRHVRQRPHDGDILRGVMGDAEVAIREAAADRDHLHIRPVIADVVADLLQAPQRAEVGDRVREDDLAAQRHPDCEPDHVLLGDAGVDELVGVLVRELLDHRVAEVADDKAHPRVLVGELVEGFDERGPQEAATSASALASSSSAGGR